MRTAYIARRTFMRRVVDPTTGRRTRTFVARDEEIEPDDTPEFASLLERRYVEAREVPDLPG